MKSLVKKASLEPLPPGTPRSTPRKIRSMFKMPHLVDLGGKKEKSKKDEEDDGYGSSSENDASSRSVSEMSQSASVKEENPANEVLSPKGRRKSEKKAARSSSTDDKKERRRRRSVERKGDEEETRTRSRSAKREEKDNDNGEKPKVKSKPRRRSLESAPRASKTSTDSPVGGAKSSAKKVDKADRRLTSPRAVVAGKKKVKRRKSIGTPAEAESEAIMNSAKSARDSVRRSTRSVHSAATSTSVGTSIGSEGYDDLMANLDAADAAAEATSNKSPIKSVPSPLASPKPKLRTTVDQTGKIRRVSRGGEVKQGLDPLTPDEDDHLATSKAQRESLRQKVLMHDAERRSRRLAMEREDEQRRIAARERRSVELKALASPRSGTPPSVKRMPQGDKRRPSVDPRRSLSAERKQPTFDEIAERVLRRGQRRTSLAGGTVQSEQDNDDVSIVSTRSAQSARSENFQLRGRLGSHRNGVRTSRRDAHQDNEGRRKAGPPGFLVTGRSTAGRSDSSVARSDVSIDSVIEKYASVVSEPGLDVDRLERELSKSEENVRALIEEQRTGQAEAAKARTELMHLKLDFQKIEKQNREMQDELRVVDDHLEEKNRKIVNLEKAVESQLDKLEDLENELKNSHDEIDSLEFKLKEMEEEIALLLSGQEGGDNSADVDDMKKRLEEKRERRLEIQQRSLDEKALELALEKKKLEELIEQQRGHGDTNEDKILLEELKQEQAETAEKLKEKDAAIEELNKKLERALEAGNNGSSDSSGSPGGSDILGKQKNELLEAKLKKEQLQAAANLQKKDDTIAFMKLEMEKLKKQLSSRDLDDTGKLKREMDAVNAEANAIRSQLEGSNRRNTVLEDEIDHWKQLNCNLEDDLDSWKSEAAEWKARFEDMAGVEDDGDAKNGSRRPASARNFGNSNMAAAKYMNSGSDHGYGADSSSISSSSERGIRSVSNLWNKLVSPAPERKPSVSGMVSGLSIPDVSFHD